MAQVDLKLVVSCLNLLNAGIIDLTLILVWFTYCILFEQILCMYDVHEHKYTYKLVCTAFGGIGGQLCRVSSSIFMCIVGLDLGLQVWGKCLYLLDHLAGSALVS